MKRCLLYLISGSLLALAFAPVSLYPFAYFAPAVLCYSCINDNPKRAFNNGLLFGLGFFGTGVSWVFISIHQFGQAPILLALAISLFFIIYLSLFYATLAALSAWFAKRLTAKWVCLGVFPACWVIFEWLRAHVLTGFPWLYLGYTQLGHSPTEFLAPIVGVYGLSFLIAWGAGALALATQSTTGRTQGVIIAILATPIALGLMTEKINWTRSQPNSSFSVALIQSNIPQAIKWKAHQLVNTLNRYVKQIVKNKRQQLILLPEGAFPIVQTELAPLLDRLQQQGKRYSSTLLFGIPYQTPTGKLYNSLMMIGQHNGYYFKQHLVPFGEYTPWPSVFMPIVRLVQIPMSNFTPGETSQPLLQVNSANLLPLLCYEVAFPNAVLQRSINSNILIVASDDSWFGQSFASAQQLQMAQMRALETGRPVLSVGNAGGTAIIDVRGKIIQKAPAYHQHVLRGHITGTTGKTPLMRLGYWPTWIACLSLIFLGLCRWFKRKKGWQDSPL